MSLTVDYKDDINLKILTRIFRGKVTVDDIISSWQNVIDNDLITDNHIGVISDYTEAVLKAHRKDIEPLKRFFDANITIFRPLKLAQVFDTPDIAYAILFISNYSEIRLKSFSTIESAIEWISER